MNNEENEQQQNVLSRYSQFGGGTMKIFRQWDVDKNHLETAQKFVFENE